MRKISKQAGEMEAHQQQVEDTIKHMDLQVSNIDQLIADLLRDIDLDELKCKERIDLAIKLMSQQARVLVLRQSCANEQSGPHDENFMALLMSRMRGEGPEAADGPEGE
ncbi:MAG: hypothetical protein NVS2B12_20180 [Ktedonobacteraceae bacterium]